MSSTWKVKQSRAQWKAKAIDRGNNERDNRKLIKRQSSRISALKAEVNGLRKENEELKSRETKLDVIDKPTVVLIALRLFVKGRIGYRAISRVLKVLAEYLKICKSPCPQTVINWVAKLGLVNISSPTRISGTKKGFSNGWIYLIDESIGHSGCKILAILGIQADHYSRFERYPGFSEMKCIGVAVGPSWTGDNIAAFLRKVIANTGRPAAFLKDGGGNLEKACGLLDEQGLGSPMISDISHVAANLLKAEYSDHPHMEEFLSTCGRISTSLKQTILACIAPPKVRHKARFMNLHRLMEWADGILGLSPRGRASDASILQRLRDGMHNLPEYKAFIRDFLVDAKLLLACQKILKTKGLTRNTKAECRKLIRHTNPTASIKAGMTEWLASQMSVAKQLRLQNDGLLISSDSIESLFGLAKSHGTGEVKDPYRIALRLPALCGEVTPGQVAKTLAVKQSQLDGILEKTPSLLAERMKVFSGKMDIEELKPNPSVLELLPSPKKRDNCQNSDVISIDCENSGGQIQSLVHRIVDTENYAGTG